LIEPDSPGVTAGSAARVLGLLAAVALGLAVVAPWIGATALSPADVLGVGRGPTPTSSADDVSSLIFFMARLPRVLGAVLAGLSLGVSGAALQGLLRNPLADPYTVGISGGAALATALVIALGLEHVLPGGLVVPAAALAGALAAMTAVDRLGRVAGASSPGALLLGGIVVSVLASSAILFLQHFGDPTTSPRMLRWMLGSLDLARYDVLAVCAPLCVGGYAYLVRRSGALNALALGDESAAGLGLDVPATVRALHRAASLVTGAAVAAVGPVAFVGLLAPHISRRLVGADHRLLLPASGLVGVVLLVVCDTASRTVFSAGEPPVGLWTALVGAPVFLVVLLREGRRVGLSD